MRFRHMTVCLDMHGCPNRCRHCWLGHTPNGNMPLSALSETASAFRPFTDSLEMDFWYREPDYPDEYRDLWDLTVSLSDRKTPHFELISVWRLVRDPSYVLWLTERGVQAVQLTLFGGEAMTDRYTGRRGAYKEILEAMEILLAHQISPRIQTFLNQETIPELPFLEKLIQERKLEERCASFGGEFRFFLHQGSCDGANNNQYHIWITPDDLARIPETLLRHTYRHFGNDNPEDIFGKPESKWCMLLAGDSSVENLITDDPVFFVDHRYDVYPNITAPSPHWHLGNLKTDGAEAVLRRYIENKSTAQHIRATIPLGTIVQTCGNPTSRKLFTRGDFITLLLNRYCEINHCEASL